MNPSIDITIISKECKFSTARSGGAGGQHVNKVETKVIIKFNIYTSNAFNSFQKSRLVSKLSQRIGADNCITVTDQSSRSQLKNKETALKKLVDLLERNLKEQKVRKKTKTPKSVIKKRLKNKKIKSSIKQTRRKDWNREDF